MFQAATARNVCFALIPVGVLFAGIGTYFHVRAWRLAADVERDAVAADDVCGRLLASLGAVERTETSFRLTIPDVVEPRTRLADASTIVAACPGHTMTRFCLGKGCGAGDGVGLVMELRRPG